MKFDQELYDYVINASKSFEESLESRRVTPDQSAVNKLELFDEPLSQDGIDAKEVIKTLVELGEPGVVSTRGGRYYGFVTGSALPVSVAASWITASWDQNGALRVMSPTSAKIEEVVGKWVLDVLDLPRESGFGFVTGASIAGFTALSAARNKLYKNLGYDLKADGIRNAPKIRFVMGDEIHPTNIIALQYMGYGKNEFEMVPCDEQSRMIASEMPSLDDHTIVLAQAGNVNSGAFDPFNEICDAAKGTGAWVHVDAAFGGWVRASHERAYLADGMERADSWSFDCHKWLNVPYDSAIAICRDGTAMQDMFGITTAYLVPGETREPSHYTPEFSRRARGIEIWAALKFLGKDGLANLVDGTSNHAKRMAHELEKLGFIIMNDVVINQIVVTLDDDEKIAQIIDHVQKSGKIWFGPTHWKGKKAFRIS
ncbi:MAG: pyridoxal-dependent decarboxylase, partial [Emcibacteraceae bacterium]|nr:pyridoxal-dependent decarboxylase [Emcibacteraceae bacterium]